VAAKERVERKNEAPKSKDQVPEKLQESKHQKPAVGRLKLLWFLVPGIWCFFKLTSNAEQRGHGAGRQDARPTKRALFSTLLLGVAALRS